MTATYRQSRGFTLVELLIVIVVIAILATISIVAYNGVQARARDSARAHALQQMETALEAYYIDHGQYPVSSGSTTINSSWSTTADSSWSVLASALQPYLASLPSDPIATPNQQVMYTSTAYDFAYFSNPAGSYCGIGANQMYIMVYRVEASAQINNLEGTCTTSPVGPYANASNYRIVKS